MMDSAASKRQRMIGDIMGAAEPVIKNMEVKGEDQVIEIVDVTESTASPELDPQRIGAIRKVQDAMYPICSL